MCAKLTGTQHVHLQEALSDIHPPHDGPNTGPSKLIPQVGGLAVGPQYT